MKPHLSRSLDLLDRISPDNVAQLQDRGSGPRAGYRSECLLNPIRHPRTELAEVSAALAGRNVREERVGITRRTSGRTWYGTVNGHPESSGTCCVPRHSQPMLVSQFVRRLSRPLLKCDQAPASNGGPRISAPIICFGSRRTSKREKVKYWLTNCPLVRVG